MNKITHPQPSWQHCPFLGLHDDSSTSLAYGSPWNYCYRANPPASVVVSYQLKVCLCPDFVSCAVYHSARWERLPRSLRGNGKAGRIRNEMRIKIIRLVELILVITILVLILFSAQRILP